MKEKYPWMRHKLCGKMVRPVVGPRFPGSDEISVQCPHCGAITVVSETVHLVSGVDGQQQTVIQKMIKMNFDRSPLDHPFQDMPRPLKEMLYAEGDVTHMKDWQHFETMMEKIAFIAGHEAALRGAIRQRPGSGISIRPDEPAAVGVARQREVSLDVMRKIIDRYLSEEDRPKLKPNKITAQASIVTPFGTLVFHSMRKPLVKEVERLSNQRMNKVVDQDLFWDLLGKLVYEGDDG